MIDRSREANTLQDAIRVRADLRLRLHDLIAIQGKLDDLGQSLKMAERDARRIGLRQSVVGSTTAQPDLDTNVMLQNEANVAFRNFSGSLNILSDQIAILRAMILDLDEVITALQGSFSRRQKVHA